MKKDNVKNIANRERDFNYDANYKFYRFCKQYDEFGEMLLDSKYNRINELNKSLNKFKALKPIKSETQLIKERIMKNFYELYEKYDQSWKFNSVWNNYLRISSIEEQMADDRYL